MALRGGEGSKTGNFASPILERSLLFGTGTPSPLLLCKISKTKDLFYDYVLDL